MRPLLNTLRTYARATRHLAVLIALAMVPVSVLAVAHDGSALIGTGADIGARAGIEQDLQVHQGSCMSLSEAVERAKRQGRVISAETRGRQHVVKVLTSDNRVKTLTFPACG